MRRARYHLRYQLHPAVRPGELETEADALAAACSDLEIEEVVLLLAAEDAHTGHLTGADEDRWVDTVGTAARRLTTAGLSVSVNPWITVGHADRGRVDDLGFEPMVSPSGQVATAQASFGCPRWREWIVAHYGRLAELDVRLLWLEDDFRYHNHAPLDWGGGFEPIMLDRLAALVGEPVGRTALVDAVLQPGPPHPWRALIQQVWREAQAEVVDRVRTEVERRSAGRVGLGLMSSRPDAHAVEGRDWPGLFDALTIAGRAAHRPHFASYSDAPGRELSGLLWLLESQRQLRPAAVESAPEIENWPYTAWTKPDVQTWSEMTVAQFAGSDALLLNVYPNHERRAIERHPRVGEMLRRARPALDWIAARYPRDVGSWGVGLPGQQDAAARIRLPARGHALSDLEIDPSPAADYLLRNGVPVTSGPARVRAVFGLLAWAFDDVELRAWLADGLLLDGRAAEILCRRGYGPLIGVAAADIVERDARDRRGPYSRERVRTSVLGPGSRPGMLSVNVQPALARLSPGSGAEVWSDVLAADGREWGPGRIAFRNERGGRVVVIAATTPAELPGSDTARVLLHRAIRFLEGDRPALPLISGGPFLLPQLSRDRSGVRLAIANGSPDPARPVIDFPADPGRLRATVLAPLAAPLPASLTGDGPTVSSTSALAYRSWLALEWAGGQAAADSWVRTAAESAPTDVPAASRAPET